MGEVEKKPFVRVWAFRCFERYGSDGETRINVDYELPVEPTALTEEEFEFFKRSYIDHEKFTFLYRLVDEPLEKKSSCATIVRDRVEDGKKHVEAEKKRKELAERRFLEQREKSKKTKEKKEREEYLRLKKRFEK